MGVNSLDFSNSRLPQSQLTRMAYEQGLADSKAGRNAGTEGAEGTIEGGSRAELFSSYSQRFNQTPINTGTWLGERAESAFMPNDPAAKSIIEAVGLDGINYDNAIPDFSPVKKAEFVIEGMTSNRTANFAKADEILAKQWGMSRNVNVNKKVPKMTEKNPQ